VKCVLNDPKRQDVLAGSPPEGHHPSQENDDRGGEGGDTVMKAFERESAAFRRLLPGLLQSSEGWFVAILREEVIDKDPDQFELAKRIDRQFKNEFVLIRQVTEDEPEVILLESPEHLVP